MGSHCGFARCVRWFGGLICAIALSLSAHAAVGYVPFPNGLFETAVRNETPPDWDVNAGFCQWNYSNYLRCASGAGFRVSNSETPTLWIANAGWVGGAYTVTSEIYDTGAASYATMGVEWRDFGGNVLEEHYSGNVAYSANLEVQGVVPSNAHTAVVKFYCNLVSGSTCTIGITALNSMAITYTPSSNSAPGEGQATDILYQPEIQEALETAQEVYDFVCGGGLEASAFSLVPDAWGGAGIGGQIAQVSNQLQMICLQTASADYQQTQTEAMTVIAPKQVIPSPDPYIEPTYTPLSDVIEAYVAPQAYQNDNMITAANRTNDLLVASIRYQNAAYERAFGTGVARPAFQTEAGPLMSETDVDADVQVDFVEGDYGQMYGRLSDRVSSSGVVPDAAGASHLLPVEDALSAAGACMGLDIPKPTAPVEDVEGALAQLRWNAAVALSGTNMGEFLCSMVDRPERTVTEFCIGSESAITLDGATLAQAEPICIYGSNAPSYMNVLIGFMPTISLLLAGVGIVKMVF